MAFKFKKIYPPGYWESRKKPVIASDGEEILSGQFRGIPAKRDEEFFMTEAVKMSNVRGVEFRVTLGAPRGMAGWLELDALLETYAGWRAFELDDMSFVHLGQKEAAETLLKDQRRIDGLRKRGINVPKIEHIDAKKLETREETRETLGRLFL